VSSPLQIDVFFDLICPWCLIGRQYLHRALAQLADSDPDLQVHVDWHPVQLVPQVPQGGWPFAEFYARRLGGRAAVRARQAQVMAAAAVAGAVIDFSRIVTLPNTARAHRLLALAKRRLDGAGQERLLDRLFAAYFQRGEDLGDVRTLASIAAEQGLDPAVLQSAPLDDVRLENPAAGVPCFVFDRRLAISGAQPAEVLCAAALQALGSRAPVAASSRTA
jgi:predicted DsbA family dithiol-disulfide isomerase